MACCAAYNGSHAYNGVVFFRFGHFLRNNRYFKRARYPGKRYVIAVNAVTL